PARAAAPNAARRKAPRRSGCGGIRSGVGRTEFEPVAEALFEVVAEDLRVLGHAVARDALEPAGVPLVQAGPDLLRGRLVGGVADEDVLEAEPGLVDETRSSGTNEILARERREQRRHHRTSLNSAELDDRAAVKHLSLDRPALEHRTRSGVKLVEARTQQRLQVVRERGDIDSSFA